VVRGRRRVRGPSVYIEFGRGGGDRGQARAGEEGGREREKQVVSLPSPEFLMHYCRRPSGHVAPLLFSIVLHRPATHQSAT
jgi:hypothetical protein